MIARRTRVRLVGLATAATMLFAMAMALKLPGFGADANDPLTVLDTPAPELQGGPWLNTPHGRPITLAQRRGKVTIVDFWTYG